MTTEEKSFHKYIYIDEELLKDSAKANKARVGLFKAREAHQRFPKFTFLFTAALQMLTQEPQ